MQKGASQPRRSLHGRFHIHRRSSIRRCASNLAKALQVFNELDVPVDPAKTEGPATCVQILGVEIDPTALELRLPADKLTRLKELTRA